MIPWVQRAVALAPGGGELRLMQRGSEFSITVGSDELMNSRRGGSEVALAEIACAQLQDAAAPHVLIGGLGMGFTLRAALDALGPGARITVAELVPDIIGWARDELACVFLASLEDPRVDLVHADVTALITASRAVYDAILLDVDNGPDGLVQSANDRIYDESGLASALRALKPAGVLAVWSATRDAAFRRRLATVGFDVLEHTARSGRASRGARHVIWTGRSPASPRR